MTVTMLSSVPAVLPMQHAPACISPQDVMSLFRNMRLLLQVRC